MNKLSNWAAMLITLYTTSSSVIRFFSTFFPIYCRLQTRNVLEQTRDPCPHIRMWNDTYLQSTGIQCTLQSSGWGSEGELESKSLCLVLQYSTQHRAHCDIERCVMVVGGEYDTLFHTDNYVLELHCHIAGVQDHLEYRDGLLLLLCDYSDSLQLFQSRGVQFPGHWDRRSSPSGRTLPLLLVGPGLPVPLEAQADQSLHDHLCPPLAHGDQKFQPGLVVLELPSLPAVLVVLSLLGLLSVRVVQWDLAVLCLRPSRPCHERRLFLSVFPLGENSGS